MIAARWTIHRLLEEKYSPVKLARKSASHKLQMRLSCDRLREFLRIRDDQADREVFLDELRLDLVDEFQAWRSNPVSPRFCKAPTLNKDLRNLRALSNFAFRRGYVTEQLFFEFETEQLADPRAWFPEELGLLFAAAQRAVGCLSGTDVPASKFWPALAATVYSTGARIGAVMQITRANVDLDRGHVLLPACTQKQGKPQTIALHAQTVAALKAIWLPERELLFPWPYDRNQMSYPTLNRHYRKILRAAGLEHDSKRLWHCLRKTNATYCCDARDEAAAQKQLGHSSPAVTARYLDRRQIRGVSAKDLIPAPPLAASGDQLWLF